VGTTDSREPIIEELVAKERLWPLLDHNSCRFCAAPRKAEHARDFSECYGCGQLKAAYSNSLADFFPVTYTTREWSLGTALRRLKDRPRANSDRDVQTRIGAVLSAYLEHQLGRLGLPWAFGVITIVPSSVPVIADALGRAAERGWWVPQLTQVATAREGFPRQRERPGNIRTDIQDKWEVARAAVDGQEVLVLDDITTSGGTIHSFAQALRLAGAHSVRAVVLARNLGVDDGQWILPILQDAHAQGRVWTPTMNKRDLLR
jgi:hypothetical protein